VQSCGAFVENGVFHLRQLREPRPPFVVGEFALPVRPTKALFRSALGADKVTRVTVANNLNTMQSRVNRMMLDSTSSVMYAPRNFEETAVFKSLVASAAATMDLPLTQLVEKGYLNRITAQRLARLKITSVGDLFSNTLAESNLADAKTTRVAIIEQLLTGKRSETPRGA
jgi:hypothetical protein